MYVVVADGDVIFSTDIDDVAWEFMQEQEGDFETIYVEEVYQNQFDSEGRYITTQEDVITLQEIVNAEQYYKDEEMRPMIKPKSTKKKAKKVSRKYWEEKVYSLSAAATKRMLQKLEIHFSSDENELALQDVLEGKLRGMLKKNDEFADSIFEELGNCSSLTMSIDSLTRFTSDDEAQEILINKIKAIDDSIDPEGDKYKLSEILFDCVARAADDSGRSMKEGFDAFKD